jgi:hypothetical protein
MTENPTGTEGDQNSPEAATGTSEKALEAQFDAQFKARVQDDPVRKWAENAMVNEQRQALDEGLKQTVSALKEDDHLKSLPDGFVRGYVYDVANADPGFAKAFDNRASDPGTWEAKLKEVREKASSEFSDVPDKKVTDDLASAKASSRESSTEVKTDKGPTLEEKKAMGDAEWRKYLQSQGASSSVI